MIVDSIRGFEKYKGLHERFGKVFEFLRKSDLGAMEPGEYEIDGKDVYCKIECADARPLEEMKLEMHDVYIDIHVLIEGNETIGFRDRALCSDSNISYDEGRDIAFPEEEPEVFVNLGEGNLVICFPSDAHAPLLGEGKIRKAVIKVRV